MPSASKMVSDRNLVSKTVLSSLKTHGPKVSKDLEALLFPNGTPQNLTLDDVLTALHDVLARGVEIMNDADKAHTAELADDSEYRAMRSARIANLRAAIGTIRTNLSNIYGEEVLSAYTIPSELPSEPMLLLQTAGNIESQLRKRPLKELPKLDGFAVDPIAMADGLARTSAALEATLEDIKRELREAQLTQQTKNEAMALWSSLYQGIADVATGIFVMTGRTDLADHVRPTGRRRAGMPEEEDTLPEAPAEPQASEQNAAA